MSTSEPTAAAADVDPTSQAPLSPQTGTSSLGQTTPARPPITRDGSRSRSFLGKKLPTSLHPKRIAIPSSAKNQASKFFRSAGLRRDTLSSPIDPNSAPLGTLVVRVLRAKDLVARDKNGLSDPFVVIRYGNARVTSPAVSKTLNPVWGKTSTIEDHPTGRNKVAPQMSKTSSSGGHLPHDSNNGEAKLEVKVFESRGFGRERIEIVVWDKDRVGRDYLGEVSLGLEDWWGRDAQSWEGGVPPIGFNDPENLPIWHPVRSSRSRSNVSGNLLVQVGFVPASSTPIPASSLSSLDGPSPSAASQSTLLSSGRNLSNEQRQRILDILTHIAQEREEGRRPSTSKEEMVLLASPTEGVGTRALDDVSPLGMRSFAVSSPGGIQQSLGSNAGVNASKPDMDSDSDRTLSDSMETAEEELSDSEGSDSDDTDDPALRSAHAGTTKSSITPITAIDPRTSTTMFDKGETSLLGSSPLTRRDSPIEGAAPAPQSEFVDNQDSTASEVPDIVVGEQPTALKAESDTAAVTTQPIAPSSPLSRPQPLRTHSGSALSRRSVGLSLPNFIKRSGSTKSVSTVNADSQDSTSYIDNHSTLVHTDAEVGSNNSATEATEKEKRKRFSRKKSSISTSTPATPGIGADNSGEIFGSASIPAPVKAKKGGIRNRRRKRTADREDSGLEGSGAGTRDDGRRETKNRRLGRRKTKRDYRYEADDDIYGLVQIEVKEAKNLPRFKNMLKTGFDMDAFLVISFGQKVFRTRVIRHSLNPVWDEKLFFHVRKTETNWEIAFNVYDWDKVSSNDHVGDVSVSLEELLGSTVQPDERGLYAASSDGKLIGDDFHAHDLKIGVDEKHHDDIAQATLRIRAKFTPYDALRQQFWRAFLRNYDIDESGAFSHLEVFSALDSLGSTLSKETIASFFTRFGKTIDQELSIEEVVLCLEQELKKPIEEKRFADTSAGSGVNTPGLNSVGIMDPLSFTDIRSTEPTSTEQTDPSSNMINIEPGTEITTNHEFGTTVQVNEVDHPPPSRHHSIDTVSDDTSTAEDGVERVINVKECPLCHKPRLNSKAELSIVTHMAICASTDTRAVNRIVVANFVTASQAQRKWFTKVISKATKGAYQLGADSANIIVQDRQTGRLQEEKMAVYVRLGIRLAYKGMGAGGGMEGARIRRMLESLSKKQGIKFDSPASAREIEPFIAFHNLNLNEIADPLSSFKTFNEFFYRKLKPEARPIADPQDPNTAVSPADCRSMYFQTVDEATRIWIKGREFSVQRLLGEKFKDKAHLYEGGSLAIFRLAPQDYHRYHSSVDGVIGPHHKIAGSYYTVNPMAIRSAIDVYGENVRLVAPIVSPAFGEVMNIWVGAMMVGSIEMTAAEGTQLKRGDEVGFFKFGGSTIVQLFPPQTIKFDEDLLENSRHSIETLVRMGSRIGRRVGS